MVHNMIQINGNLLHGRLKIILQTTHFIELMEVMLENYWIQYKCTGWLDQYFRQE